MVLAGPGGFRREHDGAVLIRNDPFDGATIVDGKVTLSSLPGIGAVKRAS